MARPGEVAAQENELVGLWRHYLPLARPDMLVASFGINLMSLALPLVTLQVYDRVIPNQATGTFTYLILGLFLVMVLETILKVARSWLAGWSGARFEHQAGKHAADRLLEGDLETIEAIPAGNHLDRMTAIDSIRDFYASQAAISFIDAPFIVLFLGLLAYIGGWLVVIPIVILILTGWIGLWLGRGLKSALNDRNIWDDRRYNFIIETLGGIHTIKSMAMEALMERRYERLMESAAASGHRVALLSSLSQSVGSVANQLTMVLVATIGAWFVIHDYLTIGSLAACTLLAGRAIQPAMRALSLWTRYQSIRVAEDKIAAIDALPRERRHEGDAPPGALETLALSNVSFRYRQDLPTVLQGINLSVKRGEIVGIQGDNGSGKTTLLHLLMGRLIPTDGEFLVNGEKLYGASPDVIRQQIAYLPQRPRLLQGSVLENLAFFRKDQSLDASLAAAARLGLDEVFARLPDGYDTKVGEASASSLPSGVAQRIAIARVLARHPSIVLFDEANSALDQTGEMLLKQVLLDLAHDTGIVLVTYRPSLLAIANRLYTLKDGTLTERPPIGQSPRALPPEPPAGEKP
ncbi:peptidase domain-containing ABC transporter [Gimibacter soli]|uniref:ABC transporter transmembrane domain-containing protein n=1 Tax=Gimibacter soli TaxID=3024400 RepID=A0AAF0BML1_9PROT|nr:ABC transporter transmembrane domain-containing protein [Gimibacter soli]WCL54661.1 ABC transporter transmembrane domain-containing protein [Gimibacter soli]